MSDAFSMPAVTKQLRVIVCLLAALIATGCATPRVWKGATVSTLSANRIVGFVGPDRHGQGRGVVIECARAEGWLWNPRGYLVVPLDADWRAVAGVGIAAFEGKAPDEFRNSRATSQQHKSLIDLLKTAYRPDEAATLAVGGKPAFRFRKAIDQHVGNIQVPGKLSGETVKLFFFTPPDDEDFDLPSPPPASASIDPPRRRPDLAEPAPRWIVVPSRQPRDAGEQLGSVALAVAITPVSLVYDCTVVPVSAAIVLISYSADQHGR